MGIGLDAQVGAALCRPQIGGGAARAPAIAGEQAVVADAFLRLAVEVGGARNAKLVGRADDGLHQLVRFADVRSGHSAFLEIGKNVLPTPAGVAGGRPGVVILRLAMDHDKAVDGRGAAEAAAARPVDAPAVQLRLGLGMEAPVVHRMEHGLAVADRQVDPQRAIARAGFEEQHAIPAVGREPIGEHAARRAGAHDRIVSVAHTSAEVSYAA